MVTWYDDDEWDLYQDREESRGWDSMICTPQNCGDCWMGDGLCRREIEAQAAEWEEFYKKYVSENTECPHCKAKLTRYQIPTTELWTWPGDFYNPMIGLSIFAVNTPKGEVHPPVEGRFYTFHHIWIGEGESREENLIMLNRPEAVIEAEAIARGVK